MIAWRLGWFAWLLSVISAVLALAQPPVATPNEAPLILAHYMPWYAAKPVAGVWGWHWTMNHFDPDQMVDGKRPVASAFYPTVGPYDSGDPAVLEYHLLTMKVAGIDGVIVDWYGREDFRDYAMLHRNTERLIQQATRLRMKFVVCYEDQIIPVLLEAGRIQQGEQAAHAADDIRWMAQHWFSQPGYVRIDSHPVLLSFGVASGLDDPQWSQCLDQVATKIAYFSQRYRRTAAVGAFDWPHPTRGIPAIGDFLRDVKDWSHAIPVVYPRFVDIYAQAGVHDSYGHIDDRNGATFQQSLQKALGSGSAVIQIATWNDWGEGTMIEPSVEYGYRDLETLQRYRREQLAGRFTATADDLRLPAELYRHRGVKHNDQQSEQLDQVAQWIASGQYAAARQALKAMDSSADAP